MENEFTILKRYFGYDSFRNGQNEIIKNLLAGHDVLAVMPTGYGKSVCFQIPAMLFGGVTIVISPLIALMKDQVSSLVQNGYPAAYLNSSLTLPQQREMLRRAALGRYKLIYVAPERLLADDFLSFAKNSRISMITVDEAHCVSQWGQDFRPDYLKIAGFVRVLEKRPVISAFTATATDQVKNDIMNLLNLNEPFLFASGFDRPNLYFEVQRPLDKNTALIKTLKRYDGKSGIIYCSTRKTVESVTFLLASMGISVTRYHAGLDDCERRINQDDFLYDRRRIMVATNAFGMGIDKSNVSFVIHYNMPKSIENYYQEAGRAGRDAQKAQCVLLYSPSDIHTNKFFIEQTHNSELSPKEQAKTTEKELERLKQMIFYCTTKRCLRSFILGYFGQKSAKNCDNCSNCIKEKTVSEISFSVNCKNNAGAYFEKSDKFMLELKRLRFSLSKAEHVPPFIIFTDAVLSRMCETRPKNTAELLKIPGIGEAKAEKYGKAFISCIKNLENTNN